ncbi:hypothetical protein [Paenibacillus lautus]|uniref:hypothetical protein n=1 Tax=Paenibacillus lautus TaxID=1401 RepID=UPI001C7DCE04|nr:hypothetical protein [Paenibacillus lautus]MBX4149147.1 hypothetical protein [Paenibacillus lautus]
MEVSNKKITEILIKEHGPKYHDKSELIDVAWPDFVEVEGCILIKKYTEDNIKINIEHIIHQFGDRTGFEASESHVHMIDISKTFKKHPLEGLRFAKKLLEIWSFKLKIDFPDYEFILILTYHDDDTILRLHRLRESEETWININDIEDFEEGIIIRKV